MKDRCKLFCRVAGSTAYYQLRDRVIDGTPCGPDTNDICVQGLCRVSLLKVLIHYGSESSVCDCNCVGLIYAFIQQIYINKSVQMLSGDALGLKA